MRLKWHVKWDPLIINVSFKCKFVCSRAYSVRFILKVWIARTDNKSFFHFFHFAPDSTAFSAHHSTLNHLPFSMHGRTNSYHSCRGSAPLNLYQIPCHFVDAAVTTGSFEKQLGVCSSFSYPVQLSLWDASNATVEVQVLFPGEQIVQCIHLRTVADVDSLVTTLHDVYQTPGGIKDNEKTYFFINGIHHMVRERWTCRLFNWPCCQQRSVLGIPSKHQL